MIANRKGQTAMEYLMTYGWAIIIVVIAGFALYRLGVFTPSTGKTSTSFDEFNVGTNFRIGSDGSATIVASNSDKEGRAVTLTTAAVGGANCAGGVGTSKNAGEKWTVTCTGVPAATKGSSYTGVAVDFNYTVGGITYSETGKINGKYE